MKLFFHNPSNAATPPSPDPITVTTEGLKPGDILIFQTKENYNTGYYASGSLAENGTEIPQRHVHLYYNKLSDVAAPITRFSEIMLHSASGHGFTEIWRRIQPAVSLPDHLIPPEETSEKKPTKEILPTQVSEKSTENPSTENLTNKESVPVGVVSQPDSLPEYGFLSSGDPVLYHLIPKGDILLKFEDGPWADLSMRFVRAGLPRKCLIAVGVKGENGYYANHKFAYNSRDAILTWHEGAREIPTTDPPHCIYDSAAHLWVVVMKNCTTPEFEPGPMQSEQVDKKEPEKEPEPEPKPTHEPEPEITIKKDKTPCPTCGDTDTHDIHVSISQDKAYATMPQHAKDSISVDFNVLQIYKLTVPLVKAGILSLIYQHNADLFFVVWEHQINGVQYHYEASFPSVVFKKFTEGKLTEELQTAAEKLAQRINGSLPEVSQSDRQRAHTVGGCNLPVSDRKE